MPMIVGPMKYGGAHPGSAEIPTAQVPFERMEAGEHIYDVAAAPGSPAVFYRIHPPG